MSQGTLLRFQVKIPSVARLYLVWVRNVNYV